MTPFLWLLAAYGLAFFFQNKMPRPAQLPGVFTTLFNCIYCLGFHSGWMLWLARHVSEPLPPVPAAVLVDVLGWGFASAAFCYVVDTAARWLEERPDFGE
jgi:hypothetical protein